MSDTPSANQQCGVCGTFNDNDAQRCVGCFAKPIPPVSALGGPEPSEEAPLTRDEVLRRLRIRLKRLLVFLDMPHTPDRVILADIQRIASAADDLRAVDGLRPSGPATPPGAERDPAVRDAVLAAIDEARRTGPDTYTVALADPVFEAINAYASRLSVSAPQAHKCATCGQRRWWFTPCPCDPAPPESP